MSLMGIEQYPVFPFDRRSHHKRLEGEWKIIAYLKDFGEQAYFVNIPDKCTYCYNLFGIEFILIPVYRII